MRSPSETWPIRRVRGGEDAALEDDALAAEEPLEIRLDGRSLVVTMRTPGHDEELAVGFLVDEGILRPNARVQVAVVRNPLDASHDNIVGVRAGPDDLLRMPAGRSFHATSACGVCGQASLDDMARSFSRIESTVTVKASVLEALPARMREAQEVFARTGGLHAAALFTSGGEFLFLREDVGRHNAVDKVAGRMSLDGRLPLSETVLLVSGRAGYEVVQKAVACGIPIVTSVGAPTSLSARLAERAGVTLVGFLKENSFNVYAHAHRVVG